MVVYVIMCTVLPNRYADEGKLIGVGGSIVFFNEPTEDEVTEACICEMEQFGELIDYEVLEVFNIGD